MRLFAPINHVPARSFAFEQSILGNPHVLKVEYCGNAPYSFWVHIGEVSCSPECMCNPSDHDVQRSSAEILKEAN